MTADVGVRRDLAEARDEVDRLKALNMQLLQTLNASEAAVAEAVILFEYIRDGDDFTAIVEGVDAFLEAHAGPGGGA
jgi:hypothetical protein